uniref:Putative secreted protein n=1 Tax=Anopheles darlingi TaxID=43151 RepID=A0A2M4DIX5_ANODA
MMKKVSRHFALHGEEILFLLSCLLHGAIPSTTHTHPHAHSLSVCWCHKQVEGEGRRKGAPCVDNKISCQAAAQQTVKRGFGERCSREPKTRESVSSMDGVSGELGSDSTD